MNFIEHLKASNASEDIIEKFKNGSYQLSRQKAFEIVMSLMFIKDKEGKYCMDKTSLMSVFNIVCKQIQDDTKNGIYREAVQIAGTIDINNGITP